MFLPLHPLKTQYIPIRIQNTYEIFILHIWQMYAEILKLTVEHGPNYLTN